MPMTFKEVSVLAIAVNNALVVYDLNTTGHQRKQWVELTNEERMEVIEWVQMYSANVIRDPKKAHQEWMRARISAGWKYGLEDDADNKISSLLISWEELPQVAQGKQLLVMSILEPFYR